MELMAKIGVADEILWGQDITPLRTPGTKLLANIVNSLSQANLEVICHLKVMTMAEYAGAEDIGKELAEDSNDNWLYGLVSFAIIEAQRIAQSYRHCRKCSIVIFPGKLWI